MLVLARLIASRYIPRIGNIHSRGTLRCSRIWGSQTLAVSTSSGRSLVRSRAPPVQVPEVGEGPAEVLHTGSGDPDVRVAPLGLVRRPDVVAADVGLLVVDHQDLAVVAAVAAQVEEAPAGGVDGVARAPSSTPGTA